MIQSAFLDTLPNMSTEAKCDIAESYCTFAQALDMLANDKDVNVRKRAARHCNLSEKSMETLLTDESWSVRESLALNANLPSHLFEKLSEDSNPKVRKAVAFSCKSPELLNKLAKDKDLYVRQAVARNFHTPEATLDLLSYDSNIWTQIAVIENPNTNITTLEEALFCPDERIYFALANCLRTPTSVLDKIAFQDVLLSVKQAISKNPNVSYETLFYMSVNDGRVELLESIAENAVSDEILSHFVHSSYDTVRLGVAKNIHTASALLTLLANDKSKNVRVAVANANTYPETLDRMAHNKNATLSELKAIASNPHTSADTLNYIFSKNDDKWLLFQIAKNPNTSEAVLKELSKNEDKDIRCGVAQNPSVDSALLEILSHDKYSFVQSDVALNRNTSNNTLMRLSNRANPDVLCNVALNPNTDAQTLSRLARSYISEVRESVAQNENTKPEDLALLSTDISTYVRCEVARNPKTPPITLIRLTHDADYWVRRSLLLNPSISIDAIEALTHDNDMVREAKDILNEKQNTKKTKSDYQKI